MTASREIILTTLNARYMHAAFGLRYLYANLGDWQADTEIVEFSIQEQALNIAETLLRYQPKIIGFSVYIWNVQEISDIVAVIKQIAPQTIIILGGPEVGHHPDVPSCLLYTSPSPRDRG